MIENKVESPLRVSCWYWQKTMHNQLGSSPKSMTNDLYPYMLIGGLFAAQACWSGSGFRNSGQVGLMMLFSLLVSIRNCSPLSLSQMKRRLLGRLLSQTETSLSECHLTDNSNIDVIKLNILFVKMANQPQKKTRRTVFVATHSRVDAFIYLLNLNSIIFMKVPIGLAFEEKTWACLLIKIASNRQKF